jgi:hypothetical protein
MDIIRDTSSTRPADTLSVEELNRVIVDLNARLDALWDTLAQVAAGLPREPPQPRGQR